MPGPGPSYPPCPPPPISCAFPRAKASAASSLPHGAQARTAWHCLGDAANLELQSIPKAAPTSVQVTAQCCSGSGPSRCHHPHPALSPPARPLPAWGQERRAPSAAQRAKRASGPASSPAGFPGEEEAGAAAAAASLGLWPGAGRRKVRAEAEGSGGGKEGGGSASTD
jgi:hypothetical protein